MQRTFLGLALLLLLPGNGVGQTAAKASALTAAEMTDHFLVGKDLWSAATDQLVTKNFVQGSRPRLIAGRPDWLLHQGGKATPLFGFASAVIVGPAGAARAGPTIRICSQLYGCQQKGLTSPFEQDGAFLSADLRRVIFFERGDIWRAEVDWTAAQLINRKQVTRVGVLDAVAPIHWYRNQLFLRTTLSAEKPILRVDLGTGVVEELATGDVFTGGEFVNPAGYRLCALTLGELLTCLDLRTGQTSRLFLGDAASQALFGSGHAARVVADLPPTFWASDDIAFSYQSRPVVVVRADFAAARVQTLLRGDDEGEYVERAQLVPGGNYLALDVATLVAGNGRPVRSHKRIDLRDGSVLVLPREVVDQELYQQGGVWLDESRYVYYHSTGGLARIGTWMFDLGKRASTRICHVPAGLAFSTADESTGLAHIPGRNALYFASVAGGGGVFRADLSTGQCRQITAAGRIARIDTRAFDLRLSVTGDALWK